MGLTKQAKRLCKSQVPLLFTMLRGTRYPLRNAHLLSKHWHTSKRDVVLRDSEEGSKNHAIK